MIRSLYALAKFFIGAGIHALNDTVAKQDQQIKDLSAKLEAANNDIIMLETQLEMREVELARRKELAS